MHISLFFLINILSFNFVFTNPILSSGIVHLGKEDVDACLCVLMILLTTSSVICPHMTIYFILFSPSVITLLVSGGTY